MLVTLCQLRLIDGANNAFAKPWPALTGIKKSDNLLDIYMIFWQIIVGAATHCAYPGLSASRILRNWIEIKTLTQLRRQKCRLDYPPPS